MQGILEQDIRAALGQAEPQSARVAVVDMNGCWRGKRLPFPGVRALAAKLAAGVRMPLSISAQDIWGADVEANPMLLAGDGDGLTRWTGRAPILADWLAEPSLLIPMWMEDAKGLPSYADSRQVLASAQRRLVARGITPVLAVELEFYLLPKGTGGALTSPATGRALAPDGVLSLDDLDGFEGFLADLARRCAAAGIAADAAISEGGQGQFEVNMLHGADALKVADDALLFRRIVKGVATAHGLTATFMAKPDPGAAGSGMHVHMSLLDEGGENVFDNGADGSGTMRHAVAGLLAAMPGAALIFAPHLNSYRRLVPGAHAPIHASWAYENRFAALRIPADGGKARRIEHRVAGADANPYLVLAAILGAAMDGIEAGREPPKPVEGEDTAGAPLPGSWEAALTQFDAPYLDPRFTTLFARVKRQELARFAARMTDFERLTYLDSV